jgi:outer membrane protein assembly factor BamB
MRYPMNWFWMRMLLTVFFITDSLQLALCCAADDASSSPNSLATEIYRETKVRGGLVIHVGSGNGELTAALHAGDGYQVQGLERDPAQVQASRDALRRLGLYGPVTITQLRGDKLPYIDDFANLIVAEESQGISSAEIERVLAPRGVAYVKSKGAWTKTVKPWPSEIDEWTHYLHGPSGNAVAHDQRVAPPERLQWLGSPRWSRHHDRMASMSAMVSAQGRVIYVMDEGSRTSILLPSHWQLIVRDAFNGTILWKKPIPQWHNQLWPLKSGPTQLARRLVAAGDRVYITPGITATLECIDAATGDVLRKYEGTKSTEEVLHVPEDDTAAAADSPASSKLGVLVTLVNHGDSELKDYAPKLNTGDQGRVATEYSWDGKPREVVVLDAESGAILWHKTDQVAPLTLCADAQKVVYCDGEKLAAHDLRSGRLLWESEAITRRRLLQFNFGPRLVLHEDVVLFAGGDNKMRAFDGATGKPLWDSPHAPSGYQSPQDVIVTGGLVWCAPTTATRDTGVFTGRDPKTGEVKKEFAPNIETYWFHHRCYIAKATDRFLLPSRTGIEFVDFAKESWDINHWVRGGCLYGAMPCNGLLYAPPHNCACYPEAKLFGLNVLAPASKFPNQETPESERLVKGPAFEAKIDVNEADTDWPTYRHDAARSGSTKSTVAANLQDGWELELGGRLSSPVVAAGLVFVAQADTHTLHAINADGSGPRWQFVAGGRIDSPPSIYKGRVFFGGADGWVYCLRASDGALIWQYLAAPSDRRLAAFEQIESVWPVHGTILVQDDVATFVAGRSCFLDGGLRYVRLNALSGTKLSEATLDDVDPETGGDLQDRLQTLQMPVGLPDILSSDGSHVYLRSQKFDAEGKRIGLGPVSGDAAAQGRAQRGDGVHLFAPMGYLDDEWFHRSEWVYGRNFAGGHNGYYQAGKVTPAGRILVFNDKDVFGFGKQPEYYKWTTTMEHHLFSAPKEQPDIPPLPAAGARPGAAQSVPGVEFATNKVLDPAGQPVTVEAWIKPTAADGVIVSHGGPQNGYALILKQQNLVWAIRSNGELATVESAQTIPGDWTHVAGVMGQDKSLRIYVNGKLSAKGSTKALIAAAPKQALEIGRDLGGGVGDYESPNSFRGLIDEAAVYLRPLSDEELAASAADPAKMRERLKSAALALTFDKSTTADDAPHASPGAAAGVAFATGKQGAALELGPARGRPAPSRPAPARQSQTAQFVVQHNWHHEVPLFARAMVLAGDTLFVAGPPDLMDEEETFQKLTEKDTAVQYKLQQQDEAWQGKQGGVLFAVDTKTGKKQQEFRFKSIPTWDGMAAAQGQLFMTTIDGHVICLKPQH